MVILLKIALFAVLIGSIVLLLMALIYILMDYFASKDIEMYNPFKWHIFETRDGYVVRKLSLLGYRFLGNKNRNTPYTFTTLTQARAVLMTNVPAKPKFIE